jgi:hypothetical protein
MQVTRWAMPDECHQLPIEVGLVVVTARVRNLYTFVKVMSKSCSHVVPSVDFSRKTEKVLPSSLIVPVKRWEKPGESLYIFQTLSLMLISSIRCTPRESK